MGSRRTFQKIAGWVALAAYLLVGVVPFSGLVLCLEPDGCLSLEAAVEGSGCGPCPSECSLEGRNGLTSQEVLKSSPCTDIPLLATPTQIASKLSQVSLLRFDAAVLPTCEVPVPRQASPCPEQRGLFVARSRASALVQQRTIVLRV